MLDRQAGLIQRVQAFLGLQSRVKISAETQGFQSMVSNDKIFGIHRQGNEIIVDIVDGLDADWRSRASDIHAKFSRKVRT